MPNCPICNKPLLKHQKMAILAFPIECINNGGDYDFLGDFGKNEKTYHYRCFSSKFTQNSKTPMSDKPINNIVRAEHLELYHALKDLGENVTQTSVKNFIEKNAACNDISDLISIWFKNRNKVV